MATPAINKIYIKYSYIRDIPSRDNTTPPPPQRIMAFEFRTVISYNRRHFRLVFSPTAPHFRSSDGLLRSAVAVGLAEIRIYRNVIFRPPSPKTDLRTLDSAPRLVDTTVFPSPQYFRTIYIMLYSIQGAPQRFNPLLYLRC